MVRLELVRHGRDARRRTAHSTLVGAVQWLARSGGVVHGGRGVDGRLLLQGGHAILFAPVAEGRITVVAARAGREDGSAGRGEMYRGGTQHLVTTMDGSTTAEKK